MALVAAAATVVVTGCFNPDLTEDTEAATMASSDTTSEPPTSTVTTDAPATTAVSTTSLTGLDSTSEAGTDDPPTVELLVDGSAMPADVEHAARIALTAEATDDGSVVRVEFYDGGELLATDDTAPYAAELLLTSVDAGAHAFIARAVDDADQVGESPVVGLTVSIEGGATVASETNLFQMGGIAFHPGIGVVHDADDNVIVAGSLSTTNFEVTGLGVISLSPDLADTNWQVSVPMALVDGEPQLLTLGQPALSADGSAIGIGGNAMGTDGVIDPNASIFRVAADGSGPLPFIDLPSDPMVQNLALGGIALDPSGNAILAGPDDDITKLDPIAGGVVWQSPVGQAWTVANLGGHRIRVDPEGDVIFDVFTCDGMASTCTLETRKINGFDGNLLWSRELLLGDDQYFMHVGGSAPGPQAQVVTLHGLPLADGGGLHMVLRDEDGGMLEDLVIVGEGDEFAIADVAYDAQGRIVAVGTRLPDGQLGMRQPFAIRFDEAGNVLWQRSFDFGMNDDQAMALGLDSQGRVVVVGIADIEVFFVVFLGDVWVAQLDL
jgi:Bacterial Ig domain